MTRSLAQALTVTFTYEGESFELVPIVATKSLFKAATFASHDPSEPHSSTHSQAVTKPSQAAMVYRWPSVALALALALAASTTHMSEAHSWIDCIDTDRSVVYDNARKWIYGGEISSSVCKGYINNYPGRGDKDINTKMTYKILMNDETKGTPPCPAFDGAHAYSNGFRRIKVTPGEKFFFAYLDNGHTSKDKAGRGTFYGVYWTGQPETSLDSTTQLTDDKLVDGTLHDFDDGNCGQTYEDGDFSGKILSGRAGNDFPCVGNLAIPAGTKPGVYNLIWFWRFYNDKVNADIITTGGHYGGAAYSSCFQVEVLGGTNEVASDATMTPTPAPTPTTVTPTPVPAVTPTPTPAPTSASPTPTPVPSATSTTPAPTSESPTPSPTPTAIPGVTEIATAPAPASESPPPSPSPTPEPSTTPAPTPTQTGYGTEPNQTPATPTPTPTPAPSTTTQTPAPTPSSAPPANSASDQNHDGPKNCHVRSPPNHHQQYLRS